MKRVIAMVMGIFLLTGCNVSINGFGINRVKGSGEIISQEMEFKEFKSIDSSNNFEVEITKGDNQKVEIFYDDNIEEYLKVNVSNGELNLGMKDSKNYKDITIKAIIQMPELEEIEGSGNTVIDIEDLFKTKSKFEINLSGNSVVNIEDKINTDSDLEIDMSGNSKLEGKIDSKDVDIELSGNAEIELEGEGGKFTGEFSGNSGVDCSEFKVSGVDITLNGNSHAKIKTDGEIKVDASGNSDFYYYGNGVIKSKDVSGNASIHKK